MFQKNQTRKIYNDGYIESVIEREKIFPTGLEFPKYCIAIPHTDSKYIKKDAIAIVKPKTECNIQGYGYEFKRS